MEQTYRDKLMDERFQRDKERIQQHEDHMRDQDKKITDLEKVAIEMGELLKAHNELIENNSNRIRAVEEKPAKNWTVMQTAAISAVTSGIVAAVLALVLK